MNDNLEGSEDLRRCEGCSKFIKDDEPVYSCEDCDLCETCAPTYADLLNEPTSFLSLETEEPLSRREREILFNKHIAFGGKATDSLAEARS